MCTLHSRFSLIRYTRPVLQEEVNRVETKYKLMYEKLQATTAELNSLKSKEVDNSVLSFANSLELQVVLYHIVTGVLVE